MSTLIFYPNGNTISMVIPTGELAIEEVARKDVPAGVPYKLIDRANVPFDQYEFFGAWEINFSVPDGYGIGSDAWFAEKAAEATE